MLGQRQRRWPALSHHRANTSPVNWVSFDIGPMLAHCSPPFQYRSGRILHQGPYSRTSYDIS